MERGKEQYFKFCMRCGSTDMKPWISAPSSIDAKMWCRKCNTYEYPMEGTVEFIEEFRKKLGDKK